jgi:hypothetical protein
MNTTNYDVWEARQITYAHELAQRCLDLYNSGHYKYSFSVNQTKAVMDYVLMKVNPILWGSTPSIGLLSTTKKQGDLTRVCLTLFDMGQLNEAEHPEASVE